LETERVARENEQTPPTNTGNELEIIDEIAEDNKLEAIITTNTKEYKQLPRTVTQGNPYHELKTMYLNIAFFRLIYINVGCGEYIDLLRLNFKYVLIVVCVGMWYLLLT